MRMARLDDELETIKFAQNAARCFAENPDIMSYSEDGKITPGNLLALRWGLDSDCVVVLTVSDTFEPVNFQNLVKRYLNNGKQGVTIGHTFQSVPDNKRTHGDDDIPF